MPPLLPAYNMFMGGVDRTDQLRKTYGFDRKSRHFWLRLFFLTMLSIMPTYFTSIYSCKRYDVRPKDSLAFRLELVRLLLEEVGFPKGVRQSSASVGRVQSERVCYLSKIGLKRGRCRHCRLKNRKPPRSSSFGCGVCKVRLCKTTCFAEFHHH